MPIWGMQQGSYVQSRSEPLRDDTEVVCFQDTTNGAEWFPFRPTPTDKPDKSIPISCLPRKGPAPDETSRAPKGMP